MKKVLFTLLFALSCLGANAQLGYWIIDGFVELTPDESFIYKYVQAMDAESQETISGLYADMKETGDKSIFRNDDIPAEGWFVRKDYPLPEGNFYESAFYNSSLKDYEVYFILPKFESFVNHRGRIEDLLDYLGDQVTVDWIKEEESGDYIITYFRLICNLKTSEEVLELCSRIRDYGFAGLPRSFNPRLDWINKNYHPYLINLLKSANEEEKLIYSMNWEGLDYPMTDMSPDDPWKTTDEGLAIVNPKMQEYAGSVWTIISTGDLLIDEDKDYMVRLTMKVPSDGTYVVTLFNTDAGNSKVYEVPVQASDDFQVIDVEFPGPWNTNGGENNSGSNANLFLNSGWVVGSTVVKKVEVYEVANSGSRKNTTAIDSVKAADADGPVYNLAGQKVGASYKGIVIQNGKKRIVR